MRKARVSAATTQQANGLEAILRIIMDGKVNIAESKIDQLPVSNDEFTNGYRDALRGIVNSLKTNDHRSFVHRLRKDKGFLKNEIARLRETEASHLCTEWDLGYFKCWVSYLQGLLTKPLQTVKEETVE
jgi:hypothetical protein